MGLGGLRSPSGSLDLFTILYIFTVIVNKRDVVKIIGPFDAGALRILRETPGMVVDHTPGTANRGDDTILRYAGTQARVTVEIKRRVSAAIAWQLVHHHAQAAPHSRVLLIAADTTQEARKILREHGIAVIDGLGNAHIEIPGLYFHLEGRRRLERTAAESPPTRLRGRAGVAAQALLLQPGREWKVQDLALETRISAGLAHRVLARLERDGTVTAVGAGPTRRRRVTDPTALLDVLAEESTERTTRTLGFLLAQTPGQLIKSLGTNLNRSGIEYALTGAAAGSLIAPFVTAIPIIDVWVEATTAPEALYEAAQATPVEEGHNLVFLQAKDDSPLAFREKAKGGLWVANRIRMYADLRQDPRRGQEQADHLRREVIGF